MIDNLLLKIRARDDITDAEEQVLRAMVGEIVDYPPDHVFIRPGQPLSFSTLVLSGLICRFKDLSDGQRQITGLHVPGDFADLHSFTLKHLDHSMMTLTPCRIAKVPHERLAAITEGQPHLTRVLWFSTNLDAAIHREWEVSLGRRTALERLAHLFCELRERLALIGQTSDDSYALPITQTELAECLGLTSVHVNRVLKELREAGLVEFRSGRVTIMQPDALRRVAEFDPTYLYLDRQSR